MLTISKMLNSESVFQQLFNALEAGKLPAVLGGLNYIHRALIAATIRRIGGRPVLLLCADENEAHRFIADIASLTDEEVYFLTSRDFNFYDADAGSRHFEQSRLQTMTAMANGRAGVTVATIDALMQRTIPKETLLNSTVTMKIGEEYDFSELTKQLDLLGYQRCETVELPGRYAMRGGILDFFSPAFSLPVRCEFFGDCLDSMGLFDPSTQRRTENLQNADILPAEESLPSLYQGGIHGLCEELKNLLSKLNSKKRGSPDLSLTLASDIQRLEDYKSLPAADRYMAMIYPAFATAAEYIPENAVIIISEPARTKQRGNNYAWQIEQDIHSLIESGKLDGSMAEIFMSVEVLFSLLNEWPVIMADSFIASDYPITPHTLLTLTAKQLPGYGGSLDTAISDIRHYVQDGFGCVVLAGEERRTQSLKELLDKNKISCALDYNLNLLPQPGMVYLGTGSLSAGFELPQSRYVVITEGQLVSSSHKKRNITKEKSNRQKLNSYMELTPGDLVVHEQHGIGRFIEVVKMQVDGIEKDYMKIAYQGTDVLYVPALQLDMVSKYIGGGENSQQKLSKLGGTEWQKTKSRAKAAAKELAKELIALYAERQRIKGHAFSPDSSWQAEFEDTFEYNETDDQLKAISQIKSDMEKSTPMDRLLCGDVGYGKTEVALRAVMKCILDGKQAAILVPTTVLAQQHMVTASRRFANFPVNIVSLSRFSTPAQSKKSLEAIRNGEADLIIGTHRLLQKDIKFHDLGLLVVDEEQRFGVAHKEYLKELTKTVDVLTLTATPIPRTLNMALSGIRDMSIIEEPPLDRHPVQTYVLEYDAGILSDAIRRETARGGQVYYLHNKVETIERTAARLQSLCPGITIAIAHGKQSEAELGEVMRQMTEGEVQVLVCTTIIETGIDIPNVNTLIIEDADKLGLAQLHQIRGRVGRSSRRAYAYLTYRRGKVLTEVAAKRLGAIREFAEFGAGFKIAMRDLEIRGAGNVLGAEQSGNMMSVGYDMYLRLLEDAVLEEKGETPSQEAECTADFTVAASIPENYVPSGQQRMDLYRRIAGIRSESEADELMDEIMDRYGEPPNSVNSLVFVALLRAEAALKGVKEIVQKSGYVILRLRFFNLEKIAALCSTSEYKGRLIFAAGSDPHLRLKIRNGDDVLKLTSKVVKGL